MFGPLKAFKVGGKGKMPCGYFDSGGLRYEQFKIAVGYAPTLSVIS